MEDGFPRHVESADIRLTKRLADVLERREGRVKTESGHVKEQQGGRDGDLEQGHQPEVAEQAQSGANPGDVVTGDDMEKPLATDVRGQEEDQGCRRVRSTFGHETEVGVQKI